MTKLRSCASTVDFKKRAQERLPAFVWSYLHSGAGEDAGMVRNEAGFAEILFRAKRLQGGVKSTAAELFGVTYDQPFGIAPVGLCNLVWPDSDRALGMLAKAKNIPYVLSTAGSSSIEDAAKWAGDKLWFQLYLSREERITADLLKRAWDVGVRVLVFTVDVPGPARRNAALRSGFTTALTWDGKLGADLVLHPSWSLSTLMKGAPSLGNFKPYGSDVNQSIAQVSRGNGLTWEDLRRIRELWKGRLVVKGVLEADDAAKMVREGTDGIWVSNHGGRQLEASPATIEVLPGIRAAVGPSVPVMIDSGVRSGEDALKALALGADLVFCGRSFMYAAAAFGAPGIAKAYEILAAEISAGLLQIGCPSADEIDQSYILRGPAAPESHVRAEARPRVVGPSAAE